jgi:PDZ domain-containing protein
MPVVALLVILGVVQVPYFVISPGPTRDVYPLIHVRGHQTYPSSGHLLMVAVDFRRANTYEALWAWLSPTEALLPERDLLAPGETDQQEQHVALSQMDTSKIDAAIVALTRYAGYPKTHGSGVLVEQVGQGLPADGKLFAGDVIQSVDGQPAQSANQVGALIRAAGPGHPLIFRVQAAGQTRTERIAPTTVKGIDHPIIGVSLVQNFPFPIDISSGDIGGPSAGLMWTLGLVDLLTPGDLTGGRVVAGTGEILPDGRVLPIGGIEEKVAAVERAFEASGEPAASRIFFVPVDDANAAQAVAHGITIVPVRTWMDAVRYLQTHPAPAPAP